MSRGGLDVRVCDLCGYENIGDCASSLRVERCVKCGRDFCPRCGEFGENGQFLCRRCGGKPSL
jgi:hypothetical protein